MTRLAVALGGNPDSLAGLAGMGDLIATCSSNSSRNTTVGVRLGRGETLEDILGSTTMVAEGVRSSKSVLELARTHGVDMPITEQVVEVLYNGRSPRAMAASFMSRDTKAEALLGE